MKKISIQSAGGYEKLQFEECPDLVTADGEVVVESAAIGVNYADCAVRWGVYESAKKFVGWPITPGFEFSGRVKAVGRGVTRVRAGDVVFGITFFNAYATQVKVPEHQVFPLPASLTLEQAAGFPAVFMTAYHALFQNIPVRPGMTMLVHSAAGGVGTALLQLGRVAGAKMVAVVGSPAKIQVARDFGADVVIAKQGMSSEQLWAEARRSAPDGYDVIFDANGHETLKQGYDHLRPTGKLVSYGFHTMMPKKGGRLNWLKIVRGYFAIPRFNPLHMVSENKGVIAFNLSFLFSRRDLLDQGMNDLLKWLGEGKIRGPQVTTFPFEKVAEAHAKIESGTSTGKLVLVTDASRL